MFTPEAEMKSWDLVPTKRTKKKKLSEIHHLEKSLTPEELDNIRNRLLQKGSFRSAFNDISFTAAYQHWVLAAWNYYDSLSKLDIRDDFIMCTGLGGETGEVLEIVKKLERDSKKLTPDKIRKMKENLRLELGDVLYYLVMIATRHGIALDTIIKSNVQKLEKRYQKRKSKKS